MRKFFAPLILSLFFFIPFSVKADTYTYTFAESDFDFVKNNLSTAITAIENEGITSYAIVSGSPLNVVAYGFTSPRPFVNRRVSGTSVMLRITASSPYIYFNSDTSLVQSGSTNINYLDVYNFTTHGQVLEYSTSPIHFQTDTSHVYIFTYGDHSYEVEGKIINSVPTMKDLYDLWFSSPPIPPDNTPLLTTFYTVVIDKIGDICTFFTSNYLYLSVFVIFLFYISILLLRRFIK